MSTVRAVPPVTVMLNVSVAPTATELLASKPVRLAVWRPYEPSSSVVAPNFVVLEIRVISVLSAVISAWAAERAAESLAPVLADCTARSRMRFSMVWTSFSAPSAVWTTEMPSWALRVAWRRPLV
ncbi:MAG: hypothetical protein R2713_09995 [Ilumatobacteraceae bacterium]